MLLRFMDNGWIITIAAGKPTFESGDESGGNALYNLSQKMVNANTSTWYCKGFLMKRWVKLESTSHQVIRSIVPILRSRSPMEEWMNTFSMGEHARRNSPREHITS